MAGMDAGDDFAEMVFNKAGTYFERMLTDAMRSGIHLPKLNLHLYEKFKDVLAKLRGSSAELAEEDGQDVGNVHVYAADADELSYLAHQMEQAGLGGPEDADRAWTVRKDAGSGYWRICVRQDRLAECDPEFADYLTRFHSLEALEHNLALEGALSQSSADIGSVEFEPGRAGNKVFGFRTVKWDARGDIMRDMLECAGVPYEATQVNDGLVKFEVHPMHAAAVEQVADVMCKGVKGMRPERFEFPEGFSDQPAAQMMLKGTCGPDELPIIEGELQAANIAYSASPTGIDGQVEIVASVQDIDQLKGISERVASREVAVMPPEQAEMMQAAYQAQSAGTRLRAQKMAAQAQRNTQRAMERQRRARSTGKDQRDMERSARQRAGRSQVPKRTHNVSKGGM